LKRAVAISGLSVSKYIYEHEALAQAYLYQVKSELKQIEVPVRILTVNLGYASTTVSISEFRGLAADILLACSERNLGLRNIDRAVFSFLIKLFEDTQKKTNPSFTFPYHNIKM